MQIVKPGTKIDFVGKRYFAGVVSGLMVVASLLVFFLVGPNWGIDFTGGTEVTLDFAEDNPVSIAEVREVLATLDVGNDAVQQIGDEVARERVRSLISLRCALSMPRR